jgi:hypothetical protein
MAFRFNGQSLRSKRFKYGSAATAMTVVVIVAVLLINAIFSKLASRFLWYTDLTSERMYTLSDAAVEAISGIDKDVTILFCDDPDNLMSNTTQRYVYETALGLEKANKYVHVETVNIWRNPSAVNYYKTNSKSNIYSTSIIVTSGTEFRVYTLRSMYVFNTEEDTEPWSYNGEKKLCAGILAVTRAEAPICCITYSHGEPFVTEADASKNSEILELLTDAGYKLQFIDLTNEEIPEDCRLLFVYDPKDDFLVNDGISDKDEIEKIDRFLDGTNAMMVFMNPSSPVLPNLEEYLEEWGIVFDRSTNALGMTTGCTVKDGLNSITQDGLGLVGAYTAYGIGASLHSDLRTTYPPKVIFPNCMGITFGSKYYPEAVTNDTTSVIEYTVYKYYSNGVGRTIGDVFNAFPGATEIAHGETVATSTTNDPFHLMTITREARMVDNTNEDYSYVLACGSTDFLSRKLLQSNTYGNTDLMLSALRAVGKDIAIANLDHKPFASTTMENITTAEANQWTAVLIAAPAVIALGFGIYVLVRRKYA